MSDLRTLHDAFAELERRADAAATAPVVRPRRAVRLVPVAATVVAVAGLFAGAMWLVPADPGAPAGPPPTALSTTTARSPVPHSSEDLIARFREVLGDTATIDVTQEHVLGPPAPSKNPGQTGMVVIPQRVEPDATTHALVGGTLTSAGITGSFNLRIHPGGDSGGPGTWCRNSHPVDCVVSTLPDGSELATETARLAPGAVSYMACVKRPDGTMVRLHVGNQEDPGGAVIGTPGGRFLSPQPPLTLEQLKAIVTSGRW
ncbi:hypothetical protein GCM10011609_62730 [Lentzea pudingi]|uniref:Uncharacterized protein n=1 Tax=Lentzea pudingi TaxID=1789439 RepID=A0ABQ2IJ84_9PSEU|nr:hypothetical protein [Lentzea pudingi]GGN13618.1 hypothetical protein GCM10011609_62730 [Lentzea pudingi]